MSPTETGERRASLKTSLLERLHDPLQLRILLIGLLLLAGYAGVYSPLAAQIAEKTDAIKREQKMAELAHSIERLQTQSSIFAKRLPHQADSKEWMQYLHEGIRGCPVKLFRLDCLGPRKMGPYRVVVLKITLEGSLYDLDQCLRWLESNPRLFRVDEISIGLAKSKANGVAIGKDKGKIEENKDDMMMQLTVLGMAG